VAASAPTRRPGPLPEPATGPSGRAARPGRPSGRAGRAGPGCPGARSGAGADVATGLLGCAIVHARAVVGAPAVRLVLLRASYRRWPGLALENLLLGHRPAGPTRPTRPPPPFRGRDRLLRILARRLRRDWRRAPGAAAARDGHRLAPPRLAAGLVVALPLPR